MTKLTALITSFIDFINNVLVPLVFAVAFIVFIFGVFRYFIAGAANPEKRKQGTELIMYSVIGFAVMMSIWGLVNLAIGTFGFDNTNRPCLPTFNATNDCAGNGTNRYRMITRRRVHRRIRLKPPVLQQRALRLIQ
jgi:hypothetical protein